MDWDRRQQARLALITELASRAPGGSIGRTALMKLCSLLQVLRGVPLGYQFTLYSYGPFDSRVLTDLSTAESVKAVQSSVTYYPGGYGYQIRPGERCDATRQAGRDFLAEHSESIEWAIREFASHGSADLELESTILYVDREAARKQVTLTTEQLAQQVRDVKPHFQEESIRGKVSLIAQKGLLKASVASAGARGC